MHTQTSIFSKIRSAYRKANGGSFLLSIGIHAVILLVGGYLVVSQFAEERKISFGGGERGAKAEVQHKVHHKVSSAPAPNKRITTTSSTAKVALPDMPNVQLNMGPSISASMSLSGEHGASGLGKGNLPMASGASTALTAFGFRAIAGSANLGLIGHLYDLKQTKDGLPTDIKDDGDFKDPHLLDAWKSNRWEVWERASQVYYDKSPLGKRKDLLTQSVQHHASIVNEFLNKRWDEAVLNQFYRSKHALVGCQFFIPNATSKDALQAFGVDKEVKPTHFLIHYKGFVKPTKDAYYRFRVAAGSTLLIRFNNENVYGSTPNPLRALYDLKSFTFKNTDPPGDKRHSIYGYSPGRWFHVLANQKYPMEILMENGAGGFYQCVMIEEKSPATPYPRRFFSELYPQDPISYCYPVFALKSGIPIPAYDKEALTKQKPPEATEGTAEQRAWWRPYEGIPQTLPEPLIFPAAGAL